MRTYNTRPFSFIQRFFNILPPFKGKLRLASWFFAKKKSRLFLTKNNLLFSVPNLTENVAFELYVNGIYEKDTIQLICDSVPKNGVLIDVGANIGAICIQIAVKRPDITIYAFEASPRVYSYLKLNTELNNTKNLYIYNLAIHEHNNIELPFYSPESANGKGSFTAAFTNVSELVRTIRLDEFLKNNDINPDFIKCDVEGYELFVFKSLKNFGPMDKTTILFEFVDWAEELASCRKGAAQNYLLEQGFFLTSLSTNKPILDVLTTGSDMIVAKRL